jgi:hypothetical protein
MMAENVRSWLNDHGYKTTIGDSIPDRWKDGFPAHIMFRQDERVVLPVGRWLLTIMIPVTSWVAQVGRDLAAELGLIAEEEGLRVGGWMLNFKVNEFNAAKARAKEAVDWLTSRGYRIAPSWGDVNLSLDSLDEESLRGLNETGVFFRAPLRDTTFSEHGHVLRLENVYATVELSDMNHPLDVEPIRRLKPLLARLTGPADALTVTLTRPQVKALLDLAGEFVGSCSYFVQGIQWAAEGEYYISDEEWAQYELANNAFGPLGEILDELRFALDGAAV